jgi:hypothetical protein
MNPNTIAGRFNESVYTADDIQYDLVRSYRFH